MPFVEREGASIYWEASGPEDAPLVLLIMGLGLSSRAWDELPARLHPASVGSAELGPPAGSRSFRVVVFDNRGVGRSIAPAGSFSVATLADDAAAVIRAAGGSEAAPIHVFGISLGGMIAQELVLRHPALVSRLVLGATHPSLLRGRWPSVGLAILFLLLILLGPGREGFRLARICVSPGFPSRAAEDWGRWIHALEHAGPRTALRQLWAALRHGTAERLRSVRAPTLVLSGDLDRVVPCENSRRLAELIPGSRLVLLPGAGHIFPLEQPNETTALLVEHFGGPVAGASGGG